jgi:hypothetical protein
VSPIARALATCEALFGQLYPAVMIARLISWGNNGPPTSWRIVGWRMLRYVRYQTEVALDSLLRSKSAGHALSAEFPCSMRHEF